MKILFFISLLALTTLCYSQNIPYKIAGIKAYLYYNQNAEMKDDNVLGSLSENLVDNKEFGLWNVIIGEGDAKGCSDQLMIVVEINGHPKDYTNRKIKLTITEDNKNVFENVADFAIISNDGKYYRAYMFNGTMCSKIKIKASILGNKAESELVKEIDFECGE